MIAALVCGRAETNPFPGRNTFPLLGRPMMVYPLLAAKNAGELSHVFLSTDDAQMARIGAFHGAEIVDRPEALRGGAQPLEAILAHGWGEIVRRLGAEPEMLVVLLANSPTVTAGLVDQAVALMRGNPSLDAVVTVTRRNDFSPRYAVRMAPEGLLKPFLEQSPPAGDAYFPDALLWVLRPGSFFGAGRKAVRPNEIVNVAEQKVGPLVHEGYGDVDFAWQIPAVEDWLRRNGFSDDKTPYDKKTGAAGGAASDAWKGKILRVPPERRVLVSTVPFCETDPGPLRALEEAGAEVVVNPLGRRLSEDDLASLIPDFGVLVAGTEPITARVMAAAPGLKLISRVGIGLDNVDLAAARARGIQVSYTPDAPAPAVAELAVGLMLDMLRQISAADRQMRNGVWHRFMGRRLSEVVVGVVGVGRIGRRVIAHLSGGFPGVRILANDIRPDLAFGEKHGVRWVEKDEIYRTADIITLHLPMGADTRHLISARQFAMMKPEALVINTSRGGIVHEGDLAAALQEGRIAGAALDVFEKEPYSGPLTTATRGLFTCHMGSMSRDCRTRMEREAVDEVVRFLQKKPLLGLVPEAEYSQQGGRGS